eukprot:351624-Chlamydomonas_euryale.AAC.4
MAGWTVPSGSMRAAGSRFACGKQRTSGWEQKGGRLAQESIRRERLRVSGRGTERQGEVGGGHLGGGRQGASLTGGGKTRMATASACAAVATRVCAHRCTHAAAANPQHQVWAHRCTHAAAANPHHQVWAHRCTHAAAANPQHQVETLPPLPFFFMAEEGKVACLCLVWPSIELN